MLVASLRSSRLVLALGLVSSCGGNAADGAELPVDRWPGAEPGRSGSTGQPAGVDTSAGGRAANGAGASDGEAAPGRPVTAEPLDLECSSYRDQPSNSGTLALRNDRQTPIYVHQGRSCLDVRPSWIDVRVFDEDTAAPDLRGNDACNWASCEAAQDSGAVGPFVCDDSCARPPLVRVEPGAQLEVSLSYSQVVLHGIGPSPEPMPLGCAPAAVSGAVDVPCYSIGPLPRGNYVSSAQAYTSLRCPSAQGCDCEPDESGTCVTRTSSGAGELLVAAVMGTLPNDWLSLAFP